MFRPRSDLPLHNDPSSRFLPWLTAFMVFLAALALAGGMVLRDLVADWSTGVTDTLTVQVPPAEDGTADTRRITEVLRRIEQTPGVERARPLAEEEMAALLEPWLGSAALAGDLPLPHLIDVDVDPAARPDAEALAARLAEVAPGASVDDHGAWLARLVALTRSVEALAAAVLALIGAATVATVVFTTRAGLAVHHTVIEVLHLIGARDAYIARQFGRHAMMLGLKGGLIGLALAAPALLGIGHLAGRLDAGVLPSAQLTAAQWIALAALPLAAGVVARLTARITVQRALRRML